jgi:aminoglycoside phosphotransferase (APT) family kinase protein
VLTEADVRELLDTDAALHRMFLNDEFEVWAVGDDLVAKFARTQIDADKVRSEQRLHPTLRRLLGDVVPAIRMIGAMGNADRRFIVYDRASGRQAQTNEGETITPADGLASEIGRLFCTLHQIGSREAYGLGAGTRTLSFDIPPLRQASMTATREVVGDAVARFCATPPPAPSARRTLCHTDIKGEHVFVDEERARVTEIIDWADTEVCDPAKDYAGLVIWGGASFARACVDASGEDDPTLAERAIWLGRAGILDYWDAVLAGREIAAIPLITEQLRIAFSD